MKENKQICSGCGQVIETETHEFRGKMLCEDCFYEKTTICDSCGKRIWTDEAVSDSRHSYCYDCYERSYTSCEDCGCIIHNDEVYYLDEYDDDPYCYSCYEKRHVSSIKTYGYKPEPIFYGSGNLFMGVELEIDRGGECEKNASTLLDIANRNQERIYCKHDGSIDEGFEIVSHPMSLDYHVNHMNWQDVFEKAVSMDYRSHNTSTCGLHVHINRSALGTESEEQEEVIGRIVFFVEKHWNELVKFSRRTPYNINRWAARYATISDTTKETYKKAKAKRMGRYVAVNLENFETLEFRLFRGTLRYETFVATLQLVYEVCRFALQLSDDELEEMSWSEFVSKISEDKKELIEYLKAKRLYVNEMPKEMEEI